MHVEPKDIVLIIMNSYKEAITLFSFRMYWCVCGREGEQHVCVEVKGQLVELVIFYHVGPGNRSGVVGLGDRHLHPRSCLTSPPLFISPLGPHSWSKIIQPKVLGLEQGLG